jgi:hypothetical protein
MRRPDRGARAEEPGQAGWRPLKRTGRQTPICDLFVDEAGGHSREFKFKSQNGLRIGSGYIKGEALWRACGQPTSVECFFEIQLD